MVCAGRLVDGEDKFCGDETFTCMSRGDEALLNDGVNKPSLFDEPATFC